MNELDRVKAALELQKSDLIGTVDEIRQDLAAQKVCICICSTFDKAVHIIILAVSVTLTLEMYCKFLLLLHF